MTMIIGAVSTIIFVGCKKLAPLVIEGRTMQDAKVFQSVISPKGDKNLLISEGHTLKSTGCFLCETREFRTSGAGT